MALCMQARRLGKYSRVQFVIKRVQQLCDACTYNWPSHEVGVRFVFAPQERETRRYQLSNFARPRVPEVAAFTDAFSDRSADLPRNAVDVSYLRFQHAAPPLPSQFQTYCRLNLQSSFLSGKVSKKIAQ